jgi:glucokinase
MFVKELGMLLAGDIGGTKTDLAIFSAETGARQPLVHKVYPSAAFNSLEEMVRQFVEEFQVSFDYACFDVAGPVVQGRAKLTNLPWVVEEARLKTIFNLKAVRVLNDLEAIANAVNHLEAGELHTINTGTKVQRGSIAVIAPGTGLGQAFMVWDGAHYRAYPSEGGHVNFAPSNLTEVELLKYLWQKFGSHLSYERVCSGIGIPNIYEFFRDSGYAPEPPDFTALYAATPDKTRLISQTALDPAIESPLCEVTLATFISILASEAGNLALKVLATGGVYIGGGIPGHILPAINSEKFMQVFCNKGRFRELLTQVPVHVVITRAALIGVASYGLELL